MTGIEDQGGVGVGSQRFEPLDITGCPEHVGGEDGAHAVESRAQIGDVDLEGVGPALGEGGSRPHQWGAWAEAEKVKLGSATGPLAWRCRNANMSPDVHETTATTWATPRRSATRSSSSRTNGSLVRTPPSHEGLRRAVTASSGGV